jgi:hypothetical protein
VLARAQWREPANSGRPKMALFGNFAWFAYRPRAPCCLAMQVHSSEGAKRSCVFTE